MRICESCGDAMGLDDGEIEVLDQDHVRDLAAAIRRGDMNEAAAQLDNLVGDSRRLQWAAFNGRVDGRKAA